MAKTNKAFDVNTHDGGLEHERVLLVDRKRVGERAGRHRDTDVERVGVHPAGKLGQRLKGDHCVLGGRKATVRVALTRDPLHNRQTLRQFSGLSL